MRIVLGSLAITLVLLCTASCQKTKARLVFEDAAALESPDVKTNDVSLRSPDVARIVDVARSIDAARPDVVEQRDVAQANPDAALTANDVVPPIDACNENTCTCVNEEVVGSCVHPLGGIYDAQACSGAFQCCDGRFRAGRDVCGACVCTETSGTTGCSLSPAYCFANFSSRIELLSESLRQQMRQSTWREGCPVALDDLRLLTLDHHTFSGSITQGELVVAATVADDVVSLFETLYEKRFPIESMILMHEFSGDDNASLAANNTSAFNCRQVTGGTRFSQHSFGSAIDINPRQNPYVRGDEILPPDGAPFVDRSEARPGMISDPGFVLSAFEALGWSWGGDFNSLKDYQHFSLSGG